jgi:DNA polymerase III epsilon subunit-like protein
MSIEPKLEEPKLIKLQQNSLKTKPEYVLIFDTETDGLPQEFDVPAIDKEGNWKKLLSIGWYIIDINNNVIIDSKYYIINTKGELNKEAFKFHKLTVEMLSKGSQLEDVMVIFLKEVERCKAIIAHNINFDYNTIINSLFWTLKWTRNKIMQTKFVTMPKICTADIGTDFCRIPLYKKVYKKPKLSELYNFVIKKHDELETEHHALMDAKMIVDIIFTSSTFNTLIKKYLYAVQ